jgi:uncharacterized protein (DUF433 family)
MTSTALSRDRLDPLAGVDTASGGMSLEAVRKRLFHKASAEIRDLGQHITANRKVCGGRPTFKGSRVMVWQVLDQVAERMPWEQICWSWRKKITQEAIAEAVQLAAGQFKEAAEIA